MNTLKEHRNELLKRNELIVLGKFEKNPGFAEVSKQLSSKFKVPEENVSVKKIGSNFGRDEFVIGAFIYDSAELKNKIEPKKKEKKVAS